MTTQTISLKDRWNHLLLEKPKLRIRDAADALKVSEAELLATGCSENVTRLQGNWPDLLQKFPHLGEVRCITRNQTAAHSRFGTFDESIAFFGQMGQVTGPEIDLRLFMSHWKYGFATRAANHGEGGQSFQFFDPYGTAVHKVFLTAQSSISVYEELVQTFQSVDQSDFQAVAPLEAPRVERPDSEVDVEGFRKGWLATEDTHEFSGLLKKFGVTRQQGLRLAPAGCAREIPLSAIRIMLEEVASQELPIMVFVGSPGCVQIHTGPIKNIVSSSAEWLSILDERFIFHLHNPLVATAWIVKKATKDAFVTSLEIFDTKGENAAIFFGKRKPGQPEDTAWQKVLEKL
ncbi:MAG: hemin-degrading factor [Verrucomicrobia bacterium]|nr:MAG: hemin-degrading factor [Verrucomicrobiota bacterium]